MLGAVALRRWGYPSPLEPKLESSGAQYTYYGVAGFGVCPAGLWFSFAVIVSCLNSSLLEEECLLCAVCWKCVTCFLFYKSSQLRDFGLFKVLGLLKTAGTFKVGLNAFTL